MYQYDKKEKELMPVCLSLTGHDLMENPILNKGTAFTQEERDEFGLNGLLPPHVSNLEGQVARRLQGLRALPSDLDRFMFLRDLQDSNETLYYALLTSNLEEILPIIYTPTVGLGCQVFSHIYRRPRGLFLSPMQTSRLDQIFANPRFNSVECIVVTDGERILGLGDQGVGGMGIPIGKLAIYSGCGGINPANTLPIMLDMGTNNPERRQDPLYLGWQHERVRGQEYDDFIEAFVQAVQRRWPNVLLQWEDFAKGNANRLLERYRDRLCTFNDDIQGTASVATGTLLAAVNITGVPLTEQRVVILGGGSAGCGIANLMIQAMVEAGMTREEAHKRFYLVGRHGVFKQDTPNIDPFQEPFLREQAELDLWEVEAEGQYDLQATIHNVKPTVLIGVAGQSGAFCESMIREMAAHVERPIIFPLSNPTSCVEAIPEDIIRWSEGRAIVATGSPFKPMEFEGKTHYFAQCNNSYIFPGVGLAAIATKARRVTDTMFLAASRELAKLSPALAQEGAPLLPALQDMRKVSVSIAIAVAKQARDEGLTAPMDDRQIENLIHQKVWEPVYRPYKWTHA